MVYYCERWFCLYNTWWFNHRNVDGTSGVWYRPVSEILTEVNEEKNNIIKNYSLFQNYPNTFNPTTTIKYTLPLDVKLIVYDVLGKEIATLVNEKKPAGNYEVTFDGSNLTSGTYFYSLISGNFKQTKKLFLLK